MSTLASKSSASHQSGYKYNTDDSSKGLMIVMVNNIHAACPSIRAVYRVLATFDLGKSISAVLNNHFVLHVLGNNFQICPVNIQGLW